MARQQIEAIIGRFYPKERALNIILNDGFTNNN